MKKKGLIVATIVMVLVLAVSLTTATYAWFSTTASTKVEDISVTVGALSDVNIGVTSTLGDTSPDNYKYDAITVSGATNNTVSYADGSTGLGSQLSIPAFSLGTAVASMTTLTPDTDQATLRATAASGVNTSSFDPSKLIIAANVASGTAATAVGTPDMANANIARANTDYIDLRMGAQIAEGKSASGVYCTVTVTTNGQNTTSLKMISALYFCIKTTGAYTILDTWGTYTKDSLKSACSGTSNEITYSYNSTTKEASATFNIWIAGAKTYNANSLIDNATISPIEIYAYIWGPDGNCVTSAAGCSCKIAIEFSAVTSGADVSTSAFVND